MIELLRTLFPDGEDKPPRLKQQGNRAWTLASLANVYLASGQPSRAAPLFRMSNDIYERGLTNEQFLAVGLSNLSLQQLVLGELRTAEWNQRRAIELSRVHTSDAASGHLEVSRILAYRGEFDEAAQELDVALNIFSKEKDIQGIGLTWAYRAIRAMLLKEARAAFEVARQAFEFWKKEAEEGYHIERDVIRAEWLLGIALVLEGKDLDDAAAHLTDALIRCRRTNLVEFEPDILLAWAYWHSARGNPQEARAQAEEALAIADRCEYRLAQAEIHNFLARLTLEAGEREAARGHAEVARERAWCDGPPYCYKVALDEAEETLRELGGGEET